MLDKAPSEGDPQGSGAHLNPHRGRGTLSETRAISPGGTDPTPTAHGTFAPTASGYSCRAHFTGACVRVQATPGRRTPVLPTSVRAGASWPPGRGQPSQSEARSETRRPCTTQLHTQVVGHLRRGGTVWRGRRGVAGAGCPYSRGLHYSLLSCSPILHSSEFRKKSHSLSSLKEYRATLACSSSTFLSVSVCAGHACVHCLCLPEHVCVNCVCMYSSVCVQVHA